MYYKLKQEKHGFFTVFTSSLMSGTILKKSKFKKNKNI